MPALDVTIMDDYDPGSYSRYELLRYADVIESTCYALMNLADVLDKARGDDIPSDYYRQVMDAYNPAEEQLKYLYKNIGHIPVRARLFDGFINA